MFGLGTTELIVIFAIVLILFGAGRLPQIGEGLGKAISGFRKGVAAEDSSEAKKSDKEMSAGS